MQFRIWRAAAFVSSLIHLLQAGLREAQPCRYFLLSGWQMNFSGPRVAPINVKFGTGEQNMPNFTFIGAEMWKYSPKTVKISNFGHKFAPRGDSFALFF